MDCRHLKIQLAARRVVVVVADDWGDREFRFEGHSYDRIVEGAAALIGLLESRARGAFPTIAINPVERVLVVSTGGDSEATATIKGDEYLAMSDEIKRTIGLAIGGVPAREAGSAEDPSDPQFWSAFYQHGGDGWELGRPTPPLVRWFADHTPRNRRALVVGCGRGHEAGMLADMGASVVAIDFAPEALDAARRYPGANQVDFRLVDLFTMPREGESYDLIVEHTCFCAIDVGRRDEYVEALHRLLRPQGELVGLFYVHGRAGGPPFSTSMEELHSRFDRRFRLTHHEVPFDSVADRSGEELLAVWQALA